MTEDELVARAATMPLGRMGRPEDIAHVAVFLARQGFGDVYNLTGGVDAWARQVDRAMPIY